MPTQKYPKWHAKMVYDEGIKWTCSPRCMLLITKGHKPTDKKQPTKIWVKEYYTLKEIDAKKAYYVSKSDVLGPMGADFIPLETQTSALDFIKEHCKEVKKDNLWTFEDINLSIIQDALR